MKTIENIKEEIKAEFDRLPDVDAKYAYLFQIGDHLPVMEPSMKSDQNKVEGCHSDLWFYLIENQGKYYLSADSDSMVIKGIAALLARLVNGHNAAEIQQINLDFIDDIGIWKLPSERNNGLLAMLAHLQSQVKRSGQGAEADGR